MLLLSFYHLGIKVQRLDCFHKITLDVWLSQVFSPQLPGSKALSIRWMQSVSSSDVWTVTALKTTVSSSCQYSDCGWCTIKF